MNDMAHMKVIDPVTLAIVQKQLDHVCKQMGRVMTRTARSPIFSEGHDFSCFVGDSEGNVLAAADGLPIHTGGGGFALRAVLADMGDTIEEGDIYISSDPYVAGGNHLPDWTIIRPIFFGGRLVAFTANRGHQSDIGGGAGGTYNVEAREIYQEGIRLPVLTLAKAGKMRKDVVKLLLTNTRAAELVEGDLHAMIGSTQLGAKRVREIIADLSADAEPVFRQILDYGELRMRAAIQEIPDGTYFGEDGSDNDCFEIKPIPVRVTMTVRGDEITVDFTGSANQTAGSKNSSLANTYSAVLVAIASHLDHTLPHNEGAMRPIRIIAPEGSVVNATPPAAMTLNTMYPAVDIINACWKALGQADPMRACAGWGKINYGVDAGRTADGRMFTFYHWNGSPGAGAVKGRDGFNCIGQCGSLGGLSLSNVEIFESQYPVRITQQEFRRDAGGAGEFRGGTGVDFVANILVGADHSVRNEGGRRPTGFGAQGGEHGAMGEMAIECEGVEYPIPAYGILRLGAKRVALASPGGGGWGRPIDRVADLVREDVLDELVSLEMAREVYGVAMTPACEVDVAETALLRQRLSTRT